MFVAAMPPRIIMVALLLAFAVAHVKGHHLGMRTRRYGNVLVVAILMVCTVGVGHLFRHLLRGRSHRERCEAPSGGWVGCRPLVSVLVRSCYFWLLWLLRRLWLLWLPLQHGLSRYGGEQVAISVLLVPLVVNAS
jgi:hypothetical protein